MLVMLWVQVEYKYCPYEHAEGQVFLYFFFSTTNAQILTVLAGKMHKYMEEATCTLPDTLE